MPELKLLTLKLGDWFSLTVELDDCILKGKAQLEMIDVSPNEPHAELLLDPYIDPVSKGMIGGREPPSVEVRFRFDEAMLKRKG